MKQKWSGVNPTTASKRRYAHAGCAALPKKTLAVIVESGNDYLIQVKGNQDKLLTLIKQEALAQKPTDSHESGTRTGADSNIGGCLYKAPPHWQQTYVGIACFLVLRRWGLEKAKPMIRPITIS